MCGQNKIAAVVLAAGYSSRMGDFKPLMKLDGITVIESAVRGLQGAGISDIMVVVGYRATEVIEILDKLDAGYILNEDFDQGMFSSVLKGVDAIASFSSGFLLLPGDIPAVKEMTVEAITAAACMGNPGIIYPSFLGKRGHPTYVSSRYFKEILNSDVTYNLREILRRHENDSIDLEVTDQGVLMDMDTPEDFREMVKYYIRRDIPTDEECTAMLMKYETPEKVIRHGEAVSEISCRIAELLNETGRLSLDIDLVRAAALLHDIAREKPHHADEGALLMDRWGYHNVAVIIAEHMEIDIDEESPVINETAIVYLADKMTKDDRLVPLKERFNGSVERFASDPEIMKNIMMREKKAFIIKESIERICGLTDLEEVLQKAGTCGCNP